MKSKKIKEIKKSAIRKQAEKIVSDSMPQIVKDVINGKYKQNKKG